MPYWQNTTAPAVRRGERLLIVAHGNTLRAFLMHLDGMTGHEVEQFEIPTGQPPVCEFARGGRMTRRYYLDAAAGIILSSTTATQGALHGEQAIPA